MAGPSGKSRGAVVRGADSHVVMNPASLSSARRHTPGMMYHPVLPGMRVTVETPVLRACLFQLINYII
jgi:hypothetical protein